MSDDSDKVINKIQKLLDKATSVEDTFPEEADTLRAKASELMVQYAIEEHQLLTASGGEKLTPTTADIVVATSATSDLYGTYSVLLARIAGLNRVFLADVKSQRREGDVVEYVKTAVGFESDLSYVQMLFLSVRLSLDSKLHPKVDPSLSLDENVTRLYEAGVKWSDIAKRLDTPDGGRLYRAYRRQLAREGREPARVRSFNDYREAFAAGFVNEVNRRLRVMAAAARTATAGVADGALVLRDRKAEVEEEFYRLFPNLRPKPEAEGVGGRIPTAAEYRRWEREDRKRQDKLNRQFHAFTSGQRAGASADLTAGRNRVAQHKKEVTA